MMGVGAEQRIQRIVVGIEDTEKCCRYRGYRKVLVQRIQRSVVDTEDTEDCRGYRGYRGL